MVALQKPRGQSCQGIEEIYHYWGLLFTCFLNTLLHLIIHIFLQRLLQLFGNFYEQKKHNLDKAYGYGVSPTEEEYSFLRDIKRQCDSNTFPSGCISQHTAYNVPARCSGFLSPGK